MFYWQPCTSARGFDFGPAALFIHHTAPVTSPAGDATLPGVCSSLFGDDTRAAQKVEYISSRLHFWSEWCQTPASGAFQAPARLKMWPSEYSMSAGRAATPSTKRDRQVARAPHRQLPAYCARQRSPRRRHAPPRRAPHRAGAAMLDSRPVAAPLGRRVGAMARSARQPPAASSRARGCKERRRGGAHTAQPRRPHPAARGGRLNERWPVATREWSCGG